MKSRGFKPTHEQQIAMETFDKNLLVSAGAGSGKTRVLVERFISLVKDGRASFHEVLAITFTRKAAREMKERIRSALTDMINFATSSHEKIKFKRLREEVEDAQLSTIHSFCSRILRENPVEAGFDPDFKLMDEADSHLILREELLSAVMSLLDSEDKGPYMEKLLSEYGVESLLKNVLRLYTVLRSKGETIETIEFKTLESINDLERKLSSLRDELIEVVEEIISINASQSLSVKTKESIELLQDSWRDIKEAILKLGVEGGLSNQLEETVASLGGFISGNCAKAVKPLVVEMKGLLNEVLSLAFDISSLPFLYGLLELLLKLDARYERYKKRHGLLDYSDLEIHALRILNSFPSVASKYRRDFKFIMVDEFQDTNEVQKDLIYLLASDDNGELLPDKLFLVGDGKQSIYRFRGANVEVFSEVQKELIGDKVSGGYVKLSTNFRSARQIIDFVNFIFSSLMSSPADSEGSDAFNIEYEPLKAVREFHKEVPFVEVLIADPERFKGDESIEKPSSREVEAALIAQRISQMVKGKELLVAEKGEDGIEQPRPVQYGDIAILFRASTNMDIYEKSLLDMNIPYYVLGGRGFYQQQEIRDVMNFLRTMANSHDMVSLVGVLRSPFFGVSDETLFWLAESGSIPEGLHNFTGLPYVSEEEKYKLGAASRTLKKFYRLKERLSLSRFIEMAIEETGLYQVLLSQFGGVQKCFNIKKVINIAKEFEAKDAFILDEFIRFVDEQIEVEVSESEAQIQVEEGDVVKLMTIHKAKGLEFPVVTLADMGRYPNYNRPPFLFDKEVGIGFKGGDPNRPIKYGYTYSKIIEKEDSKEQAESTRLLYVALTRARDHLIMAGPLGKPSDDIIKGRTWMEWIASVGSIKTPQEEEEIIRCGDVDLRVITSISGSEGIIESTQKIVKKDDETLHSLPLISHISINEMEERKRRIFPVTALTTLHQCSRRYYFDYILELPKARYSSKPEPVTSQRVSSLNPLQVGEIVHAACERSQNLEEAEEFIESFTKKLTINMDGMHQLREEIHRMLKGYFSSKLFEKISNAKRVWSEWPFHLRLGDYTISGKVDKVIQDPEDRIYIVDFKTDALKGRRVEDVAENYRFQVCLYSIAIQEIMGVSPHSSVVHLLRAKRSYVIKFEDKEINTAKERVTELLSLQKEDLSSLDNLEKDCMFCPRKELCESYSTILESIACGNL